MARIKGKYINLDNSLSRRVDIEKQINEFRLTKEYERFNAQRSNQEEAASRGLKIGELGLWKSWIKLLEDESKVSEKDYDYLHIIEDDVILSREFNQFVNKLTSMRPGYDILVTDMYVNPSIYKYLNQEHEKNKEKKICKIYKDNYTGCTASLLIHKENLDKIKNLLTEVYSQNISLLPLDNYFRALIKKKRLIVARCAPFLTTINIDCIQVSTIQRQHDKKTSVLTTQEFCTVLRQKLSTYDSKDTHIKLIKMAIQLIETRGGIEKKLMKEVAVNLLLKFCEEYQILQYQYDPRLEGEPNNPQTKR